MVQEQARASRREQMLERLGGPPGVYVVACVVLAALWFPFRLLLDEGDPVARIIAASALHGAVWALIPLAGEWGLRIRRKFSGTPAAFPSTPAQERREWARRGAIVGLAVGVPFFTALITLCLLTGRSWVYTTSFVVILVVTAGIAVRSLRRAAEPSPA